MNIALVTSKQLAAAGMLAAAVCGGLLTSRKYLTGKKSTASRLAEALLNVTALTKQEALSDDDSFALMSGCVSYLLSVSVHTSQWSSVLYGSEDLAGERQNVIHPYTHTRVDLITEEASPELKFAYAVHIPGFGEVRGTRNLGKKQISGITPVQMIHDLCQFNFKNGRSLQMETNLLVPALGRIGGSHVQGSMVIRDEAGNIARLHIVSNGSLSGALTSHSRVIGRFQGDTTNGLKLIKYVTEGE